MLRSGGFVLAARLIQAMIALFTQAATMPRTARYELRTDEDFIERLDRISKLSGLSKPQAIGAGIELLEKLIYADKEGKEFALVDKK